MLTGEVGLAPRSGLCIVQGLRWQAAALSPGRILSTGCHLRAAAAVRQRALLVALVLALVFRVAGVVAVARTANSACILEPHSLLGTAMTAGFGLPAWTFQQVSVEAQQLLGPRRAHQRPPVPQCCRWN